VRYLTDARRAPVEWVGLGLLAALVAANVLASALLKSGGSFMGLALYAVLLWRWERRDYSPSIVGALAGLSVHAVEVGVSGWSAYPDLMAINLALPVLLVPVACLASQAEDGGNGCPKR
jgi:hypothetical protein